MHLDLDMGRYAVFVWPAYGLSALVLAGAVFLVVRRARRWAAALEGLQAGGRDGAE